MKTNREIIKIWKDEGISKLVPQFYGAFKPNCLLFIGLNPSFSEKGFRSFLNGTEYEYVLSDLNKHFSFKEFLRKADTKREIQKFIGIEAVSKKDYPYYKKFTELAETLDLHWEHIDLLFVRDTKQKKLEKLYNEGNLAFNKQLKLSFKLIKAIKPKLIVVANAFASNIFKADQKLSWDEKLGTYMYEGKVPVFLTSMLTGQRTLDNGSYERLQWHLKFVIKRS